MFSTDCCLVCLSHHRRSNSNYVLQLCKVWLKKSYLFKTFGILDSVFLKKQKEQERRRQPDEYLFLEEFSLRPASSWTNCSLFKLDHHGVILQPRQEAVLIT